MVRQAFLAFLSLFVISAHAVSFSSTQYDVTAVALSDGSPDFQSAASPPMPISVSAASVGTDVATAGGVAAAGLLSTSADVSGLGGGVVSAVATSHFLGSFANSGPLLFNVDFTPTSFASGSGGGASTLFMTLVSGATTLFNDYVTGSRLFSYAAASGAVGTLELTLTSEANAGFVSPAAGGYTSFGQVTFATPVPEPQTCLLLVVGLLATAVVRHGRASQRR